MPSSGLFSGGGSSTQSQYSLGNAADNEVELDELVHQRCSLPREQSLRVLDRLGEPPPLHAVQAACEERELPPLARATGTEVEGVSVVGFTLEGLNPPIDIMPHRLHPMSHASVPRAL